MEQDAKYWENKLKGLLEEVVTSQEKDTANEEDAKYAEKLAKLEEENKDLKMWRERMEGMPAVKRYLDVPGTEKKTEVTYHGYDMRKQARNLRIEDADLRMRIAKDMVDLINGYDVQYAAMNQTTAGQGGYLVFDEFENIIWTRAHEPSWALKHCRIFDMDSDKLHVPMKSTGITVTKKAEGDAFAASDATFTEVELNAMRIGAVSTASKQFLRNTKMDVVSWLVDEYALALATYVDGQVLEGTDFTQIFGNATHYVEMTDATTVDVNVLSEAISKLDQMDLNGSMFIIGQTFAHWARTMVDTNGTPLWTPPSQGMPPMIYGYPYVVTSRVPSSPTSGDPLALFGNPKYYAIGRRVGMELFVDPYKLAEKQQSRLILAAEMDGEVGFADAFCEIRLP